MIELISEAHKQTCPYPHWEELLKLAKQYGWELPGTPQWKKNKPSEYVFVLRGTSWRKLYKGESAVADLMDQLPARAAVIDPCFLDQGGRVRDTEAATIAEAVEKAPPEVPDQKVVSDLDGERAGDLGRFQLAPPTRVRPLAYFSGPNKDWLKSMIAFLREGGFSVAEIAS